MLTRNIALVAAMVGLVATEGHAQKSNTKGFMLGVHLQGAALKTEEVPGENNETESGAGLGARLGWGFTEKLTGFIGLSTAVIEFKDPGAPEDPYGLGHLDLGLTYNFGNSQKQFRPYVELALTTRALVYEGPLTPGGADEELTQAGAGFSLGGGFNYFFKRSVAFNLGLMLTGGNLDDAELNGTAIPDTDGSATSSRFNVGLTWYPMKK